MGDKTEMFSPAVEGVRDERVAREKVPCRTKPVQMHERTRESWNDQLQLSPDFFLILICICIFQKNAMHNTLI